ncbi:hypothetical protein F5Y16DRAFT_370410 [Xylariaceae sp. FL0255]|nr:hypothetical protein F5Y16DRAFT_370410 [Xylariaceae sp. FL0255]
MSGQPSATLHALQARYAQGKNADPTQPQALGQSPRDGQQQSPHQPSSVTSGHTENTHTKTTSTQMPPPPSLLSSTQQKEADLGQATTPVPKASTNMGGEARWPPGQPYISAQSAVQSQDNQAPMQSWYPDPAKVPSVGYHYHHGQDSSILPTMTAPAWVPASSSAGSLLSQPSQPPLRPHLPQPQLPNRNPMGLGGLSPKRKADEINNGPNLHNVTRIANNVIPSKIGDSLEEDDEQPSDMPATTRPPPFVDTSTDALLKRQMDLQNANQNESDGEGQTSRQNRGGGRARRRPGRSAGGQRGPRKAAEPTGDVKLRLNMALDAYTNKRVEEAIGWVKDAIRINAETYRAWIMLAGFLDDTGEHKESFTARMFACHLQPKNLDGWLHCAEIGIKLQDLLPDDVDELVDQVQVCWSAVLRSDQTNRMARLGRADIAMRKGAVRTAAKDYIYLIEVCHHDVDALRAYAELSITLATAKRPDGSYLHNAIEYYRRALSHFRVDGMDEQHSFEWQDISLFVELLNNAGQMEEAAQQLKSLARWRLGRSDESYWDAWHDDDREWDIENGRRNEVAEFQEDKFSFFTYGTGLPRHLRAKLAVYRLNIGDNDEAQKHIQHLEPTGANGPELLSEIPSALAEVAMALYNSNDKDTAQRFFDSLISADALDSSGLLAAGRCYLENGDKRLAEECFASAIDWGDRNNEAAIDARYELAKMYEDAREDREAYILVNEAIRMQRAHDKAVSNEDGDGDDVFASHPTSRLLQPAHGVLLGPKTAKVRASRQGYPRRKVFARSDELEFEQRRQAEQVATAWATVHEARESSSNKSGPSDFFMQASKDLIDDFRSCKSFYSWEKYLKFLGVTKDEESLLSRNPNLIDMRERLSHTLGGQESDKEKSVGNWHSAYGYRGVAFNEWLDLFLEYATSLAHLEKYQEAYTICEAARDAAVFNRDRESNFLIYVTWAACALRARDEETCVASARMILKTKQYETDPFRLFSALCRLCPSPASWYASGPVQKFMMRQIKLMDQALMSKEHSGPEDDEAKRTYTSKELDATLLALYGHILFVSNSFTYALNYFLRARSIDPDNFMIQMSVGQCYIHYALKRQSENRQYLLVQGFSFLHKYYEARAASEDTAERQEAHYNMARSYHAIGINHIAAMYYQRALEDAPSALKDGDRYREHSDLSREAAFNLQQICLAGGDLEAFRKLGEKYLTV